MMSDEEYNRLKCEERDLYEKLMRENSPNLAQMEKELRPLNRKERRALKNQVDNGRPKF